MTEEQREAMILETHDKINQIHTAIYGMNGQGGCFRKCEWTAKEFYNFRLYVIVTTALILGGGGLGVWKVVNLIAPLLMH